MAILTKTIIDIYVMFYLSLECPNIAGTIFSYLLYYNLSSVCGDFIQ